MKPGVSVISLGAALLLTLIAAGCATAGGKSTARVTVEKKYIRLNHLADTSQQTALKKANAIAMACSKCKTVELSFVQAIRRQTPSSYRSSGTAFSQNQGFLSAAGPSNEARHYCPGCKSTITTTGSGKNKQETVKHTCQNCGDNSMFCCTTGHDASPTEGMARK